jgi:hypothetical protein
MTDKRTWNNPTREPWNAPIAQMLKAIDEHNREYFRTGNRWHLEKAMMLRGYLVELKEWVMWKEGKSNHGGKA